MRTVIRAARCMPRTLCSSAARAQRRSRAGAGSPRRGAPYCTAISSLRTRRTGVAGGAARLVVLVGIDDALHQRVPHHVLRAEVRERDAADFPQHLLRLYEPAFLAAREVDLGDVAVDYRLAAEPDAGQEHFHLLGRRVLRLVQYHERMVERASAHEGE